MPTVQVSVFQRDGFLCRERNFLPIHSVRIGPEQVLGFFFQSGQPGREATSIMLYLRGIYLCPRLRIGFPVFKPVFRPVFARAIEPGHIHPSIYRTGRDVTFGIEDVEFPLFHHIPVGYDNRFMEGKIL